MLLVIFFPLFTDAIDSLIKLSVFLTASEDSPASFFISSATTAKPFPASPALAASIAALSESKFICSAISYIVFIIFFILLEDFSMFIIASSILFIPLWPVSISSTSLFTISSVLLAFKRLFLAFSFISPASAVNSSITLA